MGRNSALFLFNLFHLRSLAWHCLHDVGAGPFTLPVFFLLKSLVAAFAVLMHCILIILFDFLFFGEFLTSHSLSGLVTCYTGLNVIGQLKIVQRFVVCIMMAFTAIEFKFFNVLLCGNATGPFLCFLNAFSYRCIVSGGAVPA